MSAKQKKQQEEYEGFIDFSVAEADLGKFIYLLKEGIWYAEHLRDPGDEEAAACGRNFLQTFKPIWLEIEAEKTVSRGGAEGAED